MKEAVARLDPARVRGPKHGQLAVRAFVCVDRLLSALECFRPGAADAEPLATERVVVDDVRKRAAERREHEGNRREGDNGENARADGDGPWHAKKSLSFARQQPIP